MEEVTATPELDRDDKKQGAEKAGEEEVDLEGGNQKESMETPPEAVRKLWTESRVQDAVPADLESIYPPPTILTSSPAIRMAYSLPGAYANAPGLAGTQRNDSLAFSLVGASSDASVSSDSTGMWPQTGASTEGLVEARPVDDHCVVTVASMVAANGRKNDCATKREETACVLGLTFVGVVGLILACLSLTGVSQWGDKGTADAGVPASTAPPTKITPQHYVEQYLPTATLQAINQSSSSPQAQALQWMMDDPHLFNYTSPQRILQRYALATFYHATNGSLWTYHDDDWLSYEVHECNWWSGPSINIYRITRPAGSPCRGPEPDVYTHLWLGVSGLEGTLPMRELTFLYNLESIDLQTSSLTGPVFIPELLQLTNLKELSLAENDLTGTIMTEIAQMTNLEVLFLGRRGNSFHGNIPTEIGLMTNLQVFSFSNNLLTGTIPTEIGTMSSLSILDLSATEITGTLPTEIGLLSQLWLTYMFRGRFSGPIPSEIGRLTASEWFHIPDNAFTGTIPTELGSMERMKELKLAGNLLSGTIPSELGLIPNLFLFDASRNQLQGTLPTQLGGWTALGSMVVNNNTLTGTLPTALGGLSSVQILDLSFNEFVGQIPQEWHAMEAITELYLNDNAISGTLPTELGLLGQLLVLNLANNNITGSYPSAEYWPNITQLELSSNPSLSGRIPDFLCTHLGNQSLRFDCNPGKLCGCDWCSCDLDVGGE